MQEYARRAKDSELIAYVTEIRLLARRKLGQLMAAQKEAGLMARGGEQYPKATGSELDPCQPSNRLGSTSAAYSAYHVASGRCAGGDRGGASGSFTTTTQNWQ